jgi:myo-inositol-1(or 4)-monophosphatase
MGDISVSIDVANLCHLVIEIAKEEILPRYRQIKSRRKADGSLVTEADLAVQSHLRERLQRDYPGIALLGEEMAPEEQAGILRQPEASFWCLDPLDGTSNYVAGMPCFATSLAYIHQGEVRVGIIYDPLREECFHAVRGEGAWLNGERLVLSTSAKDLKACVAMVDFKRLSDRLASQLATHPPYRSQRSIGSVALDWCWLAAGRLQLYLHGGAKLWDYAAGTLIYQEAGGHFRLTPGHVSQPEPWGLTLQPCMAVAAADETLFRSWDEWLRRYD